MTPLGTPFSHFDIIDACAQPGCPLCRLSTAIVQRYLDAVIYEYVNDPAMHDQLSRSLGYCNEHTWRLPDVSGGAALGVSIVYRDLLNDILQQLGQARYERPRGWFKPGGQRSKSAAHLAAASLEPQVGCPACAHRDQMEQLALTALVQALARADPPMQSALQSSTGLCLVHLRRALALAPNAAAFNFLRDVTDGQLARLVAELTEYIRKCDYRFSDEVFGPEADSWRRALAAVVGARGLR